MLEYRYRHEYDHKDPTIVKTILVYRDDKFIGHFGYKGVYNPGMKYFKEDNISYECACFYEINQYILEDKILYFYKSKDITDLVENNPEILIDKNLRKILL